MNLEQLQEVVGLFRLTNLPLAMGLLLVGWLVTSLVSRTLDDLGERFAERRLALKRWSVGLQFLVYAVLAVTIGWMMLDLDDESKQLVVGGLIVALGFALQDTAKTFIAGLTLLFDAPFQVGDRISFGGYYGEVQDIGLRSVRLVTLDDNLVTIPNSELVRHPVPSANAGALDMMCVISLYLRLDADADRARTLLSEVAATSRYVFLDKPIATVIQEEMHRHSYAVRVDIKAYVFDARYEEAFSSDVVARGRRALAAAGIPRPDGAF